MKKLLTFIFTIMMVFILVACGNNNRSTTNSDESTQTEIKEAGSDNTKDNGDNQENLDTTKQNILIAYFSHTGNTKVIAEQVHENVGGDLFEIKTIDPYTTDYNTLIDQAKKEQEENYRPKLATKVDNISSYDVIFIGYPNWWGTMPMAVFGFLEQYNLSGKTIVPFCTHEGSALGRSMDDIKKLCPQSRVVEGLAIRGKSANDADKEVSDWLNKIGMIKK